MKSSVLLFILCWSSAGVSCVVTLVSSTLTCEEGKTYFSVYKRSIDWGTEESYDISSGGTVLQRSSPFGRTESRTDEYCLATSPNDQYTITLVDRMGDSWDSGAFVSVTGLYGNVVFKYYLTKTISETFPLSMHYAVKKTEQWKIYASSSSIASDWTAVNFGESAFTDGTLGSVAALSGTQYFRKHFTGLADLAAYEAEFNYCYGIVAYVNGKEIYRDNMPTGAVEASTASSGSYEEYGYHGVIRSMFEVTTGDNVLAVELHFPSAGENAVEFDAYVALLASTLPTTASEKCYVYPYDVTITGSSGTVTVASIFDYSVASYYSLATTLLPTTVTMEMGGPRPFINGLRVYPYTNPSGVPSDFVLQGSADGEAWANIINRSGEIYTSSTYSVFYGYFNTGNYRSYRLQLVAIASGVGMYAYEFQPAVCAVGVPTTMTFDPASYTYYAYYQEVDIHPTLTDLNTCTLQPALPAGLTLDAASCTIHGVASAPMASTVFTMTSTMNGLSISGSFTLEVVECQGTLTKVLRTYKYSAYKESFSIKDQATQQVVLSVAENSGQVNYEDWTQTLCLTGTKYEIDMGASSGYWESNSFMYVNALLYGSEYETIARVRFDSEMGLGADRIINARWAVAPKGSWEYKMGEVPANWQTASGWESAAMGSYPASTNTIQLYKKTFTVDSLENTAAVVISLRYLYGCVVYLNGHEAFRNGVTGDLSASSVGLNAYTDLLYRQISLPVKTLPIGDQPSVNYLQQGSNTIAIAIVSQTTTQTASVFDCAVRLALAGSRVFDCTADYSSVYGDPNQILGFYHSYSIYQTRATDSYWGIVFGQDRREWISSVMVYLYYNQQENQPRQFTLKARNTNLEEWTTLAQVTGLSWSLKGEHKRIWIENNKPYNQYRFENFMGKDDQSGWKLGTIDFLEDYTTVTVPELAYTTPIVVVRGIEMGEVYANSEYFYEFAVTPALPTGINLDSTTGKISGTCDELVPATTYTITAKKVGGGSSTTTVVLSVEPCFGGKNLITLVVRTDSWPQEGSYKLYAGKGTSGEVVSSNTAFSVNSGLNYADFCVPHALYTLETRDSQRDGWENPAGWWLTVDVGEMIVEMGQMPAKPSVSTSFSSLLPFQINYDSWKLFNSDDAVPANWKAVDFDDAAWQSVKAEEMGNHNGVTAYIRHEVQIPSLEDYHVLNVRVKYIGGLAVYFNGNLVARFNLEENFRASTEGVTAHDASSFSKFHVILSTVGAVAGKNVMAFEVHRVGGQSAIVFDATGVFGVNDCSSVQDTYAAIDASPVMTCTKEDLLDLNPTTYGYIPNTVGSYLAWTVENLEGSKFNSFAIQTSYAVSGYGFSVYARWEDSDEYTSALAVMNQDTNNRQRNAWEMPVGIAGFKQFRFEVDHPASDTVYTNAYVMQFCKASGTSACPAVGEYPAVGEGQISPGRCAEGFRGYSYRECHDGALGEVKNDKCEYKWPDNIQYATDTLEFVLNTEVSSGKPTYSNIITEFFMQDNTPLPAGLSINPTTGEISGKPTVAVDARAFKVRGKNPKGETCVEVIIIVRKGICQPEGVFERTNVGEIATYPCSLQGSYVGTQTRACVLGEKDGEWQKASGVCLPIIGIVVVVLIVIIIIVVVVFIVMRTRKTKSVGGVKGKAAKNSKAMNKKPATKAVKV